MNIAKTILEQIGGNRFAMITGSKNFIRGRDSLTFQIPRNISGANRCKITLNANDLYDVEFFRSTIKSHSIKKVSNDVFAEDLENIFENVTGLYTRF